MSDQVFTKLRARIALTLLRVGPLAVLLAVTMLGLLLGCGGTAEKALETPEIQGSDAAWTLAQPLQQQSSDGMVVSGHPLASRVGAEVLASGGNAIDAAVAVGFALAAVLPAAGNVGGGGFLVYRQAGGEAADVVTLDYRETAPAEASRDMYLDEAGEPTDRSVTGHLAAGVPGSVSGLSAMHERFGTVEWADLVQPAVELARGHVMDQVRHDHLVWAADRLSRFEASSAQFLPADGAPVAVGEMWRQPELASTLERIRDRGVDGFYRGETAELVVAEMQRGGGILTAEDLANYRPVWRDPIVAEHHGFTLYSMPPPSSGGITLALILNMLENFSPLPELGSPQLIHLETEAMRRAFIERNLHLADPDFVELPMERLQSQSYADQLAASISPEQATVTDRSLFEPAESLETTHYSIVDRDGNAASVTTTINGSFGSAVTVTGAGFLLNNEMDDFAAAPGKPNQYGLVEGEANAIAPGKRMLSSMTPTIVVDEQGELRLVLGSPGGPTIITSVFQVARAVLDHGVSLPEAVHRPRLHHQALPDVLFFEPGGLSPDTREALRALGHELRERDDYSGDVAAILRMSNGDLVGVADPRRGGAPSGVPLTDL